MELMFEIVRILDKHSLINAESYQCTYETDFDKGLAPGYYAVLWDTQSGTLSYDVTAQFLRPCASRTQATDLVERAKQPYYVPADAQSANALGRPMLPHSATQHVC